MLIVGCLPPKPKLGAGSTEEELEALPHSAFTFTTLVTSGNTAL